MHTDFDRIDFQYTTPQSAKVYAFKVGYSDGRAGVDGSRAM